MSRHKRRVNWIQISSETGSEEAKSWIPKGTPKWFIIRRRRISGLSIDEAKDYLIKNVRETLSHEIALEIKEAEGRAKEESDKKAKNLILIYGVVWEIGAKDRISVDSGRERKNPLKGLLLSLFANLPNILFALLCLLFLSLFLGTGREGWQSAFGVFNLVFRFMLAPYLGIVTFICRTGEAIGDGIYRIYLQQSLLFLALPAISLGTCAAAYLMGFAERRIFKRKSAK